MKSGEEFKTPVGQIKMIIHKGGEYDLETDTIKNGIVIAKKEVKNLIVDNASKLMACRMAPGKKPGDITNGSNVGSMLDKGLQYLAVGVGILMDPTRPYDKDRNPVNTTLWDPMNPISETEDSQAHARTALRGEFFRKEFTGWCFVEDNTDITGDKVSNVLKLVTTFTESEAVGPLTEMGLFGGNATFEKDSGYMFNYKTFPVWNKPKDARLTITWKLTF